MSRPLRRKDRVHILNTTLTNAASTLNPSNKGPQNLKVTTAEALA
jgi:hypothetical protein